jgi:hypothetical protein
MSSLANAKPSGSVIAFFEVANLVEFIAPLSEGILN